MKMFSPAALACFGISLLSLFLVAPARAESPAAHRFEKDIAAFEAADRQTPPPKGAILFVGDSTFTRWKTMHEDLPHYTVINRGFGGSQMADLLYFVDRVVQEGGNDLHGGRTPEALLADMKAFVEKVQAALPGVPIVFGNLTPSPARWSEVDTRRRTNAMLQEFAAAQKGVTVLNFFDEWLGADGQPRAELYVEDHLHPSALGYHLRVKILRPVLGEPEAGK